MKIISRIGLIVAIVVAGLIIAAALPRPIQDADSFVGRDGTRFTLNGHPFYVAGANNHYLSWGTREEVDGVLNDAAAMRLNVIRTFMGPVVGSLDGHSVPTIWQSNKKGETSNLATNGVYEMYWDTHTNQMAFNDGPDGIQKMDYVIYKARSLNLKLLISFLDFWEYTGGAQQMRAWYSASSPELQNVDLRADNPYQGFLQQPERYSAFFSDSPMKQAYQDWVKHVLEHVNIFNGVAYKDEPTIFGWDLMNEPQAKSIQLAQSWIAEMSAYVKSIDTHHLVASGTEGFYGGMAGSDPDSELTIPTIDFGTWHMYPAHHDKTPDQVRDLIEQHCTTGLKAQKPVLFEEFGYGSQNGDQADVYQSWTNTLNNNKDCAGWLFWRLTSKQDNGRYPRDNYDHFDVHNDGSPAAQVFQAAAIKSVERNVRGTASPVH